MSFKGERAEKKGLLRAEKSSVLSWVCEEERGVCFFLSFFLRVFSCLCARERRARLKRQRDEEMVKTRLAEDAPPFFRPRTKPQPPQGAFRYGPKACAVGFGRNAKASHRGGCGDPKVLFPPFFPFFFAFFFGDFGSHRNLDGSESNIGVWQIFLEGPKGSVFEGGVFELEMKFPDDYPENPPSLHFKSEFWHPNVYPDGKVCMSALHPPGDNEMDGEGFDIRWKPINSVSSILNCVLLILQEPNFSSPANVDASIQWRREFEQYKKRINQLCVHSKAVFDQTNSSVFIPHPDTNPQERSMYKGAEDDEDDKDNFDIEDMDDSGGGGSGSEANDDDDDDDGSGSDASD